MVSYHYDRRDSLFTCLLSILISGMIIAQTSLPTGTTSLFSGSGNCARCHQAGSSGGGMGGGGRMGGGGGMQSTALTYNGLDVSPVTIWRSAMMGNSSKDPLWRAVVSGEVTELPAYQSLIESKCTRCHVPMGYTQSVYNGNPGYSFAQLKQSSLDNDGISCTACHQITSSRLGTPESFTGGYVIGTGRLIYGPYQNPLTNPMQMHVNYKPVYGAHQVNKSEYCGACHTLFTNYVDYNGNVSEELFPEQTPYLEWQNSIYPGQNTSCQSCHMPLISSPIVIATMPMNLGARSPYLKHTFVGGNAFTPAILKYNSTELKATASAAQYDATISEAKNSLKNSLNLTLTSRTSTGSLLITVRIENLTGHKLPTAHPFRRMWIHIWAKDNTGKIVFESGKWDSKGEIIGQDADYEPHYSMISDPNQVQIYQAVFTDALGKVSTTLLRAKEYIKDNRIPPKGFSSAHSSYDVTAVIGNAASDADFNKSNGTQGTGADLITYQIPATAGKSYTVTAEICYQTTQPSVINNLRNETTDDITAFTRMYDNMGNAPVIIKSSSISVRSMKKEISEDSSPEGYWLDQNYPNPFNPTTFFKYRLAEKGFTTLKIVDAIGNDVAILVSEYKEAGSYEAGFTAKDLSSGIYYCIIRSNDFYAVRKIVLLK